MKLLFKLLCLFTLYAYSFTVFADKLCTTADIFLTDAELVPEVQLTPFPNTPTTSIPPTSYSECIGAYYANSINKPLKDSSNNGTYLQGILNGQSSEGDLFTPENTLFDPFYHEDGPLAFDGSDGYNPNLAFITPNDLQDFDGDSLHTDPGWVYLGRDNGSGFDYRKTGEGILPSPLNIGDLLEINFTCDGGAFDGCNTGEWSIMPNYNIADSLYDLFGTGVFDHLALQFKSSTPKSFAIYDFNFNELLGGSLDLNSPYNLYGTYDLSETFSGRDISHIGVWARDPEISEVSEPRSTLLLLIGIALTILRYRKVNLCVTI